MKARFKRVSLKSIEYEIALILLMVSTVCFYRLDTMMLFIGMNAVAGVIVVWKHFQRKRLRISITPFLIWITSIFAIFILYGFLFLRAGSFNADRYVISYAQCVLYYCIFKALLSMEDGDERLSFSFSVTAIICIVMLLMNEGNIIQNTVDRVGATLTGNVNAFGMALGIMSMFLTYHFGKTRDKKLLVLIVAVVVFMLATGSKKIIVYLIADIYIIYTYAKNKAIGQLVLITLACILLYVIFGIDYFYNLIGSRIIDMLGQLGFQIVGAQYSNSTAERLLMIQEGFDFWLDSPLWGNGANYFQLKTQTRYAYSHCNITELLCSYGVLGTVLYYFPFVDCLFSYKRLKQMGQNRAVFAIILVILVILVDWMAVTYSSYAICYIPIIYFFVLKELSGKTSRMQ